MSEATCKTCPFWEERPGRPEGAGRDGYGFCHHVHAADEAEPNRYGDWWCSEHPQRQRDRLAAMAMQGILSALPTQNENATLPFADAAQAFATQAYEIADAMLSKARGETP